MNDYYVNKNKNNRDNDFENDVFGRWAVLFSAFSVIMLFFSTGSNPGFGIILPAITITLSILSRINVGRFTGKAIAGLIIGIITLLFALMVAATIIYVMNDPAMYSRYIETLNNLS